MLAREFVESLETGVLLQPRYDVRWQPTLPHDNGVFDGVHFWHFRLYRDRPTILFCHGNSGNITYLSYTIEFIRKYHCNLLLFDYTGYGHSPGEPSLDVLKRNAEAMYRLLTHHYHVSPARLAVFGESLGGVAAIHVAAHSPCSRLVLWGAFANLDLLILPNKHLSALWLNLYQWLYRYVVPVDNLPDMRKVKCPVAFVHSVEDEIVPFVNALALYHSAVHTHCKILIPIQGHHADPKMLKGQTDHLFRFLFDATFCTPTGTEFSPRFASTRR